MFQWRISCYWFNSGASIARGSPRTIGQKPEPTIRRGMTYKGSLREGAGAEGDWGRARYNEVNLNFKSRKLLPPLSRSPSLSEGGFGKLPPTEKHHQRKILGGVRVFSAKNAESMRKLFSSFLPYATLTSLSLVAKFLLLYHNFVNNSTFWFWCE